MSSLPAAPLGAPAEPRLAYRPETEPYENASSGPTPVGKRNFSAFRSSACSAQVPVRKLKTLTIGQKGDQIEFILEATLF